MRGFKLIFGLLRELSESLPPEKNRNSSIWVRRVIRPVSFVASLPFLALRIMPDTISYVALITAAAGLGIFILNALWGSVILNLWLVLDCVDGNIARYRRIQTVYGDFIDSLSSLLLSCGLVPGLGLYLILHKQYLFSVEITALISIFLCILTGFVRVSYQKFFAVSLEHGITPGPRISKAGVTEVAKRNLIWLANRAEKNLGISGFIMPSLVVGSILDFLGELWLALIVITGTMSILGFALILAKVKRHNKLVQQC